jgi:hypothetical protein
VPVDVVASTMSYSAGAHDAQIGLAAPKVVPPSADVRMLMLTLAPLYCIQATYTYGADGSAAMAGSHPSPVVVDETIDSPFQPTVAPEAPVTSTAVKPVHTARPSSSLHPHRPRSRPTSLIIPTPF